MPAASKTSQRPKDSVTILDDYYNLLTLEFQINKQVLSLFICLGHSLEIFEC